MSRAADILDNFLGEARVLAVRDLNDLLADHGRGGTLTVIKNDYVVATFKTNSDAVDFLDGYLDTYHSQLIGGRSIRISLR